MKYGDILKQKQIDILITSNYINKQRKAEILKSLEQRIDNRFSGFQHCIVAQERRHNNEEPLEGLDCLDPFCIDQNKIKNSKAFRRLDDKAQVLPNAKEKDIHIRNRKTHSLEVEQLSALFCDMLNHKFEINKIPIRLNKDLCKAQALGHDIGHTPLGHIGEKYISEKTGKKFKHNIYSTVISQEIERKGQGLNLTGETLGGIKNHTTNGGNLELINHPQEEAVIRIMDKVAYVISDTDDGIRQGYISENNIDLFNKLGDSPREKEFNILSTLVTESFNNGYITFGDSEIGKIFISTRKHLINEYYNKVDKKRQSMGFDMLDKVYSLLQNRWPDVDPVISLSLLSDGEVIKINEKLILNPNTSYEEITKHFNLGINEILPYIGKKTINREQSDLERHKNH